ncbi:hypothetical protein Tco_0563056, partial [Tanacetum coccineum]
SLFSSVDAETDALTVSHIIIIKIHYLPCRLLKQDRIDHASSPAGRALLLLEVHIPLLGVERYTRNRCSA